MGEGAGDMRQQRYTQRGGRGASPGDGPGTADCVPGQPPSQPMGGVGPRFEFEFEICVIASEYHTKLNSRVSQSSDVNRSVLGFFAANPNPD